MYLITLLQASPRATPKATPLQSPRTESAPVLPQESTPNQTTKPSEPSPKAAPSIGVPPPAQTPTLTPTPAPTSATLPSQVQPVASEPVSVPIANSALIPGLEQEAKSTPAQELTFHQIEQKHQEQIWEAQRQVENSPSSASPASPPTSTEISSAEVVDMTASMIAKQRITTEEEAKAALAERRRLAREQAEREAELERQRLVSTNSYSVVFATM